MAREVVWLSIVLAVAMQQSGAQVAHVNVVSGASESECLSATRTQLSTGVNCSSVGHALQLLRTYISETPSNTITVHYDHVFDQDGEAPMEMTVSTALQATLVVGGFNNTVYTVHCSSANSGVSFVGFQNVTVSYLSWEGCAIQHNTTAFYTWLSSDVNLTFPIKAYSAMFFFQCNSVQIVHCTFANSTRGSGLSIYDAHNIVLQSSDFVHNRGELKCVASRHQNTTCSPEATGVHIEKTLCGGFSGSCPSMAFHQGGKYVVSHCKFTGNVNPQAYPSLTKHAVPVSISDHWPFGKGGGVIVALRGNITGLEVSFDNCSFSDNQAYMGGGMTMLLHPKFSDVALSLTNCKFISNIANDSGGGLRFGVVYERALEPSEAIPLSNITLNDCLFYRNSANRWGGGMSIFTGANNPPISTFEMLHCNWTKNQAHRSGPALGITSFNVQLGVSQNITIQPRCHSCTFQYNFVTLVIGTSRGYGYGAVFLQGVPMVFTGNTAFTGNTECALCISSTSVYLHDSVTFRENKGFTGGGIKMIGTSWINLTPNLNLMFYNNTAVKDGGAIHYTYPPSLSLWDFNDCFIQYSNKSRPFCDWNVTVIFAGNRAFQDGDAVYISNAEECTWSDGLTHANPFNATNNSTCNPFDYSGQNRTRAVSTPPLHIVFDHVKFSNQSNKEWYTHTLMSGGTVYLNVTITDYFKNNVGSVVSTVCHTIPEYLNYEFQKDVCTDGNYSIEGLPNTFGLESYLADMQLKGTRNSSILLLMQTNDMQPVVVPLLLNLTDCDLGFVPSNTKPESCVCFSKRENSSSDNFLCINDGNDAVLPCIRNGYWYGEIGNGSYGIQTCIYGTCSTACGKCGYLPRYEWCRLPSTPSGLCHDHRSGPLCSECEPGWTLTYDYFSCAKFNVGKGVGLWLLFVLYWAFIILQLIAMIKLDVRIGSGYLYIFLYYFSVLRYIMWYTLPTLFLTVVLKIFGTLTRLDPQIYAYTDFCLYERVTSVQYEALHYLHSVVILTLIALLVILSHFWSRFTIFSGYYAIQTICYVLLLAYTSLAETSINLLNPMEYHPPKEGAFVQIQPGTKYMDPDNHLPYALLALAVELVIVLPFSIFMLIAPLLGRYMNLIRVKPILDEYQSCYKDKYRWFAGVYLLGRQLFLLTSILSLEFEISQMLNQIFCTLILLLHATIHPYRQRWLNHVDTFFLANLTLLSFLYSGTGTATLSWNSDSRAAVIAILILLPCLYLFLLFTVIFTRCLGKTKKKATSSSPLLTVGPSLTSSLPEEVDDEFPSRLLEEESKHRSLSRSSHSETQPLIPDGKVQSWYQRLGGGMSVRTRPRSDNDTGSTTSSGQ